MALNKLDIGAELGKAWKLFQANMALLIIAGVIACCIGVFFTIPIGYSMLVCGYETVFGSEADAVVVEPPPVDGTSQL